MRGNYTDSAKMKKRMYIVLCFVSVVLLVLTIRLSYIMIFKSDEYSELAVEQWTSEVKISAKRGKILDRNGEELAISANVYRVDFDLNAIRDYNKENGTTNEQLAEKIANALNVEYDTVLKKLEYRLPSGKAAGAAIMSRRIEKEYADNVKALDITGVIVSPDTKRYYPKGAFLSHALGTTNSDGVGLNGIELQYDSILSGTPGVRITEIEDSNLETTSIISKFTAPVDGKDVVLTIDSTIQYFAEKIAEIALKEHNADAVTILVMNPNNGEVLAMANMPDFDPNKPYEGAESFTGETVAEKVQKMWRNRSVSDSFEPGSIFKIVTASAALEEGLAGGDETYECSGGTYILGKYVRCWKHGGHGTQSFDEILQNSCNVAFMQLGEKLGAETLNKYIKLFGLGSKSGVDLPGETPGIVKKTEKITELDLATIAFGQTNTVNCIQFLSAVNTVANGGNLIQPHLVKEISHIDSTGNTVTDETFEPNITSGFLSEETINRMRSALEKTVHYGSPKATYMEGYGIAGKTGTAQKINSETGGYGAGYIASFVGFAPYNDPQISVLISVDNPKNGEYYGGRVAAPLANMLFTELFNYIDLTKFNLDESLKIEKAVVPEVRGLDYSEARKMLMDNGFEVELGENDGEDAGSVVTDMLPKPGYSISSGSKITLYTGSGTTYNKDIIVPDFTGYSKEEAQEILQSLGIKGEFQGEGTVIVGQNVEFGEIVKDGDTINFTLGKL